MKTRLILGFGVAALLPLLLLAFFSITKITGYVEENTGNSIQQNTNLIAPEFDNLFRRVASDLKVLTQSNALEGNDDLAIARYLNEAVAETPVTSALYFFDKSGTEIARSGSVQSVKGDITGLGVKPSLFETVINAQQSEVFYSDVLPSQHGGKYILVISPVTDDSNLVVIGVLVSRVSLSIMDDLMERLRTSIGTNALSYLLHENGELVTSPPRRGPSTAFEEFADDKAGRKFEQDILRRAHQIGSAGQFVQLLANDQKELVIFHDIGIQAFGRAKAWLLVIRVPWASIIAPSIELARTIAALAAAAIAIAIIAGFWMARTFTRPLAKISESAAILMRDDTDPSAAIIDAISSGPKELVLLSQALSQANGKIASRTHDMNMALRAAEQARAEAERSSAARAAFLAIMSHEIRTPLNGMLGMIQLLEMNKGLNEQQAEYLHLAHTAGESLLQILTDVLDLSKIESEAFELEEVEFNIDEIIAPVLSIFRQTASSSIKIQYNSIHAHTDRLLGDPIRIRQIVWNLVSNAVKFTPEGSVNIQSKIITGSDKAKAILSISIIDTGIGIKEEDQKKILEPFNQADTSLTRPFDGVGLGLTVVQKLLSAMGGELSIVSKAGKGTLVNVDVPVTVVHIEDGAQKEDDKITNASEAGDHSQQTALVVDDNKLNAMVAAEMLKQHGMRTFVANGGREALEILNHHLVDFVILDQHMPIMDGTSTAAAIRNHADHNVSRVKIIGLTADARSSNKEAMKQAGMNFVLTKPIRHETLMLTLKNISSSSNNDDDNSGAAAS